MSTSSAPETLPGSSTSGFSEILDVALNEYKARTGQDIRTNPFAVSLQTHNSPETILEIFRNQAQVFDKYRKGHDKLAACFTPIVNILFMFSATLGEAIGLPFSPAKAIFTGISVLLGVVKDEIASYETLVNLFERINFFLQRLNRYTGIPLPQDMIELLGKIMAQVLLILALSTKSMKEIRIKKFMKRLAGRTDVEDALQRLDTLTKEESLMTVTRNLEVTHDVVVNVTEIKEVMRDIHGNVAELGQRIDDQVTVVQHQVHDISDNVKQTKCAMDETQRNQLREKLRAWLVSPDPSINHNTACDTQHQGTGSWFLRGCAFNNWKKNGSVLWVNGNPGSGKSVLCSAIIEDIKCMRRDKSALIAYYYFDFKDAAKRDVRGLLTSILRQLVDDSDTCWDVLYELYEICREGSEQPSDAALAGCLKSMLQLTEQVPVFIVIDALDECPNVISTPSNREKVLKFLKDLIQSNHPNLHICITSRPEQDILSTLNPLITTSRIVSLHEEGGQSEDIRNYIRTFAYTNERMRRWKVEDKELVISTLTERAGGMFRWVYCQLDNLSRCFPSSIRSVIAELPTTLDDTYERTLQGIPNQKQRHALRLFQCIVAAVRPLRIEELAEILAIKFDTNTAPSLVEGWRPENPEEEVLSACSTLISIIDDEGVKIVQFSHFSVKEFLTSDRLRISLKDGNICQYYISLELAHTVLAQACMAILLRLDGLVTFPLASYAAEHWVDHAKFENVASQIEDSMKDLFNPNRPHLRAWTSIHDIDRVHHGDVWRRRNPPPIAKATALYYAVSCGFSRLARHLILMHADDVNAKCGQYGTPLHVASYMGHVDAVRVLLDHGADVNVTNASGISPLLEACTCNHPGVVKLLLEHGADVEAEARLAVGFHRRPLHIASGDGRVEIVQLLLQHNAEVNALNDVLMTPLHYASSRGHLEVVQLLLKHNADINLRSKVNDTPIRLASQNGSLGVVRLLLRRGAEVNTPGFCGLTALQAATERGHHEVAQLLLEYGAH